LINKKMTGLPVPKI